MAKNKPGPPLRAGDREAVVMYAVLLEADDGSEFIAACFQDKPAAMQWVRLVPQKRNWRIWAVSGAVTLMYPRQGGWDSDPPTAEPTP